jgi:hypothetical protein
MLLFSTFFPHFSHIILFHIFSTGFPHYPYPHSKFSIFCGKFFFFLKTKLQQTVVQILHISLPHNVPK